MQLNSRARKHVNAELARCKLLAGSERYKVADFLAKIADLLQNFKLILQGFENSAR